MFETFMDLYIKGNVAPESWTYFVENTKHDNPEMQEYDIVGISKEEYEDLKANTRNIQFYAFKRKYRKTIDRIWTGAYIKFAFQYDLTEPHVEYGWVDIVDQTGKYLRVQCDDTFEGQRQLTLRSADVLEILPTKERKLIFYKTMVCGDCKICNRVTNDFPGECPQYNFFNAILNKQIKDDEFFQEYFKLMGGINESDRKTGTDKGI